MLSLIWWWNTVVHGDRWRLTRPLELVTNSTYRIYCNLGFLDRGHEVLSVHLFPFLVSIMILGQFRTRNCCARELKCLKTQKNIDVKNYSSQTDKKYVLTWINHCISSNNGVDRALSLNFAKHFLFPPRDTEQMTKTRHKELRTCQQSANITKQHHRKGISFLPRRAPT